MTATALLMAKAGIVFTGVAVFLRFLVKEYARTAESMAGVIARAALDRERRKKADGTPGPRVTLTPAPSSSSREKSSWREGTSS